MTDPVLILMNGNFVAVERKNVDKKYQGPQYEAPVLKEEIEKWKKANPNKSDPTTGKSRKSAYDHLVKLAIVGDKSVGKKSLLIRYAEGSFTPSFITNIGIDFKFRTIELEEKVIKQQIWLTQNIPLGKALYIGIQGIVLTYDVTNENSYANLKQALTSISRYAREDTKIIIVGTKADLDAERKVSFSQIQEFVKLLRTNEQYKCYTFLDPIEVSAKTEANIETCFETLTASIMSGEKKELGNTFPKKTQDAIQRLQTYKVNRDKDSRELYHGKLSRFFGGFSKTEKFAVVDILIEILKGDKTIDFLAPYLAICEQGELKNVYNAIKPLLPQQAEAPPITPSASTFK
jgi:GTPase SAR1 family protein